MNLICKIHSVKGDREYPLSTYYEIGTTIEFNTTVNITQQVQYIHFIIWSFITFGLNNYLLFNIFPFTMLTIYIYNVVFFLSLLSWKMRDYYFYLFERFLF